LDQDSQYFVAHYHDHSFVEVHEAEEIDFVMTTKTGAASYSKKTASSSEYDHLAFSS